MSTSISFVAKSVSCIILNVEDDDLGNKGEKFHNFLANSFCKQESSKMSSGTFCVTSTLINLTAVR